MQELEVTRTMFPGHDQQTETRLTDLMPVLDGFHPRFRFELQTRQVTARDFAEGNLYIHSLDPRFSG